MMIGSSLKGFRDLSLDQIIPVYHELSQTYHLNVVEIPLEYELVEKFSPETKKFNIISEFVDDYKMSGAHLPYKYLDLVSQNIRIKKESMFQIKSGINFASNIGLDYCVLHIQSNCYERTRSEVIDQWIKVIYEMTELAEETGIILSIENAGLILDLSELVQIIKKIDSKKLKMTLDLGHAHFRVLSDPFKFPNLALLLRIADVLFPSFYSSKGMPFEKYHSLLNFISCESKYINNLHIHDYDGKTDHLPIGDGKIDFTILKEIRKSFQGAYVIEINFSDIRQDFRTSIQRIMKVLS